MAEELPCKFLLEVKSYVLKITIGKASEGSTSDPYAMAIECAH